MRNSRISHGSEDPGEAAWSEPSAIGKGNRGRSAPTGRNSGVAHAGIYYAPESLKARLCREGLTATREFCAEHAIPFEACGKLIVATNSVEEERLAALYDRAGSNGVALERPGPEELSEREPAISGVAALLSSETGMVDFCAVSKRLQSSG